VFRINQVDPEHHTLVDVHLLVLSCDESRRIVLWWGQVLGFDNRRPSARRSPRL